MLGSLHKCRSFPLKISIVPVDLVTFTGEILNGKLHFFVQWILRLMLGFFQFKAISVNCTSTCSIILLEHFSVTTLYNLSRRMSQDKILGISHSPRNCNRHLSNQRPMFQTFRNQSTDLQSKLTGFFMMGVLVLNGLRFGTQLFGHILVQKYTSPPAFTG